jgi:Leucine-rich repeat (LRR) protein
MDIIKKQQYNQTNTNNLEELRNLPTELIAINSLEELRNLPIESLEQVNFIYLERENPQEEHISRILKMNNIKYFSLYEVNIIIPKVLQIITNNDTQLQSFILNGGVPITLEQTRSILERIYVCSELNELGLISCGVGLYGLSALSLRLLAMQKLTRLDLSFNSIEDENLIHLRHFPNTLQELHLSDNDISCKGAIILAEVLRNSDLSNFKLLDLSMNRIGIKGLSGLFAVLNDMPSFKELDLSATIENEHYIDFDEVKEMVGLCAKEKLLENLLVKNCNFEVNLDQAGEYSEKEYDELFWISSRGCFNPYEKLQIIDNHNSALVRQTQSRLEMLERAQFAEKCFKKMTLDSGYLLNTLIKEDLFEECDLSWETELLG